jgi:tRNA(adenine34) deaminase
VSGDGDIHEPEQAAPVRDHVPGDAVDVVGAEGAGRPDGIWDQQVAADDHRWMAEALAMAEHGLSAGELPIGAVVVAGGSIVGRAFTQERTQGRLLVHAELLALDQADRTHAVTRTDTVLYTTLEPCLMCLGAAATAMVDRVVFALASPGDGAAAVATRWERERAVGDIPHVRLPPVIGGVSAEESRELMRRFRAARPDGSDPLAAWVATLIEPAPAALSEGPDGPGVWPDVDIEPEPS